MIEFVSEVLQSAWGNIDEKEAGKKEGSQGNGGNSNGYPVSTK
jgi:hypothetical protein